MKNQVQKIKNSQLFSKILSWVIRVVFMVQFAFSFPLWKTERWWFILLTATGILIAFILSPLIHELGHTVGGLVCGLSVKNITVGFLSVLFLNSNKVKFKLHKAETFGYTELVPKTQNNYAKKVIISTVCGLAFTLIQTVIGMLICIKFLDNMVVYALFGISFYVPMYLLLLNLFPIIPSSDGSLIFRLLQKDEKGRIVNNYFKAVSAVFCGVEPKNIDGSLLRDYTLDYDEYSVKIIYLRYLAYLDNSDGADTKELEKICDREKLFGDDYETVYKELFFNAILRNDVTFIKTHSDIVVGFLQQEKSPCDYRIHAVYRMYTGDREWAKLILKTGLNYIDNFSEKGLVKAEKHRLESLLSELGKM